MFRTVVRKIASSTVFSPSLFAFRSIKPALVREFGTRRIIVPKDVAKIINLRCASVIGEKERSKLFHQVSKMWQESGDDYAVSDFSFLSEFKSSDVSAIIFEGLSANGDKVAAQNIALLMSRIVGGEVEVNSIEDDVDIVAQECRTLPPHFDFGCNFLALYGVKVGDASSGVKTYLLDPQKILDGLGEREKKIAMSPMFVYELETPHPLFWYVEDFFGDRQLRAIIDSGINNFEKMQFVDTKDGDFTAAEARDVMSKIVKLSHELFESGRVEEFEIRTDDLVIINNEAVLHGRGDNLEEYFQHIAEIKMNHDFIPQNSMPGRVVSRAMTIVGNSWSGKEWLSEDKEVDTERGKVNISGAILAVSNGVTSPILLGEDGEYYSAYKTDKKKKPLDKERVQPIYYSNEERTEFFAIPAGGFKVNQNNEKRFRLPVSGVVSEKDSVIETGVFFDQQSGSYKSKVGELIHLMRSTKGELYPVFSRGLEIESGVVRTSPTKPEGRKVSNDGIDLCVTSEGSSLA